MIPVILSGGSGTRLWPLSRRSKPKQFLSLTDENTMLQNTLLRVLGNPSASKPLIVCNEEHRFIVAEQLREIGIIAHGVLLEPDGRNTASAIAAVACYLRDQGVDENLLVLPSDHQIKNEESFQRAIQKAESLSEKGYLVTFGIEPEKAETGYGYIKKGKSIALEPDCTEVMQFVEKPTQDIANKLYSSGHYLWNSGMFMFKASDYLSELEQYTPEVLSNAEKAVQNRKCDLDFIRLDRDWFIKCPDISVDYAVMEKTEKAATVPLNAGWSDLGSWSALWSSMEKCKNNNASRGDVVLEQSQNCLAISEHRLVTVLGMKDSIVVETADSVLVADLEHVQDIKKVVEKLKSEHRTEATEHRQGFRPWGMYDCIDKGYRFQVKRITVKPGETLSLQMHHHRAEHWVVVSGTAKVRCGDKTTLLTENQSSYIPLGELHQLSNPGKVDLELIEVQSGSYLGEDDIERFEDHYGR